MKNSSRRQKQNPNPNLRNTPDTNADPNVTNRWFTSRLSGTLRDPDMRHLACIKFLATPGPELVFEAFTVVGTNEENKFCFCY